MRHDPEAPEQGDGMLISVVVPCFNVGSYVGAALQSLLAQSHGRWEAVFIDDGSTDGTADLIADCADARVRLIRQANLGVSAARNRGIDTASGDALLFLDADDWLAPDAMERMAARLQGSPVVAVYGAFCFVTEDGAHTVRIKSGPFPEGDIVERLLVENLFANGGHLLIRRSAIEEMGRFRDDLRFGEDWEYWSRLALCGAIAVVPGASPLLFVRQRSTGAYLRMATNPAAFAPCVQAIFGNPMLRERLSAAKLDRLRTETESENSWIVGRELVRHGRRSAGVACLRDSFRRRPRLKRALLLVIAHLMPLWPARLAGPFRPYGS